MSRFLITLAAVVVAGAMYVAAAPGSQQAGPSAAQFRALKKEVSKLQKHAKAVDGDLATLEIVNYDCMLHTTVGVAQKGDPGGAWGYDYLPNGGSPGFTSALDLSDTPTTTLLTLNPDPQLDCASIVGLNARRPGALAHWAKLHH